MIFEARGTTPVVHRSGWFRPGLLRAPSLASEDDRATFVLQQHIWRYPGRRDNRIDVRVAATVTAEQLARWLVALTAHFPELLLAPPCLPHRRN
jgi:hypothetical protein